MIIKFKERDSWVIFGEIDHLEYQELGKATNQAVDSSVLLYMPGNYPAEGKYIGLSFFSKHMSKATVIHAFSPIYLMNDEGRTIETIN